MLGSVLGAAADSIGQAVNKVVENVVDKDKKTDFEALLAPVPQAMKNKYPGLELLMIPGQVQMVLHQKIEAAEVAATMCNMAQDQIQINMETPNKYAVKTMSDGVTLYIIAERPNGGAGYCSRANCRTCMPFNFDVVSARSQKIVASVESPWACDNCCWGTWCCVPVCCCLRGATFYRLGDGEEKVPIASVQEVCSCDQCGCLHKYSVRYHETTLDAQPFALEIRTCCAKCFDCSGGGMAEASITDGTHPYDTPLGRIWPKAWVNDYEPTTERYPAMPKKGVGAMMANLAKEIAKDMFTDADTYLMEFPHDGAPEKAALITGTLINDMCYHEDAG